MIKNLFNSKVKVIAGLVMALALIATPALTFASTSGSDTAAAGSQIEKAEASENGAEDSAAEAAEDAKMAKLAKITEAEAISIAKAEIGATDSDKAITKGVENENGKPTYEVSITKAGKTTEVKVNALNGTVSTEDNDVEYEG